MDKAFFVESIGGDIGVIYFDLPHEKINKLSTPVMDELSQLLDDIRKQSAWKAVIFASRKPGIFIAGADIKEIEDVSDAEQGYRLACRGQAVFQKVADLPYLTVAAIDGACLGGGLEFALACRFRVVSDHEKTSLGLPETKLGIIPGFGGTQRLPKVVGLPKALEMITSGSTVDGPKAYKIGLADEMAHSANLLDKAVQLVRHVQKFGSKKYLRRRGTRGPLKWLERTPGLREIMFSQARKAVLKLSKGQYPAPLKAIVAIQAGANAIFPARAYEKEARIIGELIPSPICKNLIHLFYLTEAAKKDNGLALGTLAPPAKPLQRVGVLGAGVMGGGIAWLLAHKDVFVQLKDIQEKALQTGLAHAADLFEKRLKQRRMTADAFKRAMLRIRATLDYNAFHSLDAVIEAVVEDMKIKKAVLRDVEKSVSPQAIIASNTSSLSISEMASALRFPERFGGFHFFNPVHRMPLIEVIYGKQTSPETLVALMDFARKLGKTPVPVKDGPGFLVNRLLVPYMNEAALILQEGGAEAAALDEMVAEFGMPMGPLTLIDEIGIDVGYKVIDILYHQLGERMKPAQLVFDVYSAGWLGKKSGQGFYVNHGSRPTLNQGLEALIEKTRLALNLKPKRIPSEDAFDRMILPMINEGARCLEEGIVRHAGDADLAMVFGTGFPAFRGGLLRYADSRGVAALVDRLHYLRQNYGDRFRPCAYLERLKTENKGFYELAKERAHASAV